ncbi:hypothetical protein N7453_001582 [Penicillium expansum]|nr:hypothetical protein N7453_001582 [Penicillium expansum]
MSSDEKTPSKSIFAKPPVKIVVGSDERVYYVHRGTLEVHPAFEARLKTSTDEYEEAIDWSGFDEQTIDCVLSFLYTGGYQAPQVTSVTVGEDEAGAGEEAPAQDGEEGEEQEQEVVVDEAEDADEENEPTSPPDSPRSQTSWPHSPSPTFPARARSLSPVAESSIASDSPPTQAMSEILRWGHSGHGALYSFARQLDFAKLEQFALNHLAQVLVALEQTDKVLFPYLADAIRLIYTTTSAIDDARNLLSQFVALRYTTLVGEDLDELITDGGEFVVDLSHKLARKLATIELAFKRVEYLTQRNDELRAESVEKDKELKTLREEVRHGPAQGFPTFTYQI